MKTADRRWHWAIDNWEFLIAICVSGAILARSLWMESEDVHLLKTVLGLLTTLSFYVVVRLFRLTTKLNSIQENSEYMKKRLPFDIEATVLYDKEQCYQRLNQVINKDSYIEATYFTTTPPVEGMDCEEAKYWNRHQEFLNNNACNYRIRRLVTIENTVKLDWVKQMMECTACSNRISIRCLAVGAQLFPLLNVVIVDRRYTMIFGPHDSETGQQYFMIDSERVAASFHEYFEALWRHRTLHLADGNFIDVARLGTSEMEQLAAYLSPK